MHAEHGNIYQRVMRFFMFSVDMTRVHATIAKTITWGETRGLGSYGSFLSLALPGTGHQEISLGISLEDPVTFVLAGKGKDTLE